VSVPVTLSDLESREAMNPVFFPADPRTYARTVRPTAIKFDMVTHVGRGVFIKGQTLPHPNVLASARSNLGAPQSLPTPFDVERLNSAR